jgi:predicted ATP-grasp superfamily ATP-dependent carboligase
LDLLICGATARAAALSALRAGIRPVTFDLFADTDLTALCRAGRIAAERYPAAFVDSALSVAPCAWLYTGSLENHPGLVDRISERHRLMGNVGAVLRAVRDPFRLSAALREAGIAVPGVRARADGLPRDGSWLVKPRASAGGLGIEPLGDGTCFPPDAYFQERIDGARLSAVFLADRAGAELVGITRQLAGCGRARFAYAGNVGPWPTSLPARLRIADLGRVVANRFTLAGLFGIDFILRDDVPWPVEVNPRYTASVEVLELATARALVRDHVRAVEAGTSDGPERVAELDSPGSPASPARPAGPFVGKAVVYAEGAGRFPALGVADRLLVTADAGWQTAIADVPARDTAFQAGDPVLTVFATGATVEACEARLSDVRRAWDARLRAT